jgi:hypothetical protein
LGERIGARRPGMTFYCVNIEFYHSGKRLACVTSRKGKALPRNLFRQVHGMDAYLIFLYSEKNASEFAESVTSGRIDSDDLFEFYSLLNDHREQEKKEGAAA